MSTSVTTSAIILITLLSPSMTIDYRQQLVAYTVNFIQHLQSQHHGFFQIWFYHAAPTAIPSDPILQEIQSALNLIPQLSLNAFDSRWVLCHRQPIPLVIVHFESVRLEQARWQNFTQMLTALDSHSKVLILASFASPEIALERVIEVFQYYKTYNLVFLSMDWEMYVYYHFTTKNVTMLMKFPNFEDLFPNPVRHLNGMAIVFLPPKYQMINHCPSANHCIGYDLNLIEQVADYVNATVHRLRLTCDGGNECSLQAIEHIALDFVNCPYDFFTDQVSVRGGYQNHFVRVSLLANDAFLVPRGRSLNVVELFVMPFRFEVWTLLLCGLIAVKIASYFMAGGFQNDVLLLPICGFERFDLNRASQTEKIVIFSLIVFFFFLTNAYESKFIALMTNRPPAYEINTLEDILHLNLPVKASKTKAALIPDYHFNYIFAEDVNYTDYSLDGTSVYITNEKRAEAVLQRPESWDYTSNQPRYKILDQRLRLQLPFYLLPVRSLIKPTLDHVQTVLFEAGLLPLWFRQMVNIFFSEGKPFAKSIPVEGFAPTASILKFSDLLPLWMVLALGCLVSFGVFVGELGGRSIISKFSFSSEKW